MSGRKMARELVSYQREAEQSGWQLKATRHGLLWLAPSGEAITVHVEHGSHDPRSTKNAIARLRRAGLTGSGGG